MTYRIIRRSLKVIAYCTQNISFCCQRLGSMKTDTDADIADLLADSSTATNELAPRRNPSLCSLCCLYLAYLCEYFPRFCFWLGCVLLIIPSYFLIMAGINPTEEFGVVSDFSDVTSNLDSSVGLIDHWCLRGDDDCKCEDPLQPQARAELAQWARAHVKNKEIVSDAVQQNKAIDIAFVGSSVIEEMQGRWFGKSKDTDLSKLGKMFKQNFSTEDGAKVEAVALGIAGDTRLLNGEMPSDFNPKIWWLELGMNDLGRTQCSEEVVVLGILRIIEEIRKRKPDAEIVINSMFPMARLRGGLNPKKTDFKDSFFKDALEKAGNGHRHLREDTRRKMKWFDLFGGEPEVAKPVRMSSGMKKQKKYKTLTHTERRLPLWTSISSINDMLKKFCAKHQKVTYFDATEIFATREDNKMWLLKTSMISLRGHPTQKGFAAWEAAVVQKANMLLNGKND